DPAQLAVGRPLDDAVERRTDGLVREDATVDRPPADGERRAPTEGGAVGDRLVDGEVAGLEHAGDRRRGAGGEGETARSARVVAPEVVGAEPDGVVLAGLGELLAEVVGAPGELAGERRDGEREVDVAPLGARGTRMCPRAGLTEAGDDAGELGPEVVVAPQERR